MQPSIICLGSPMMDISINVNQDFLTDNNIRIDCAYDVCKLQSILAITDKNGKSTTIGGSITNTARIIQWLGQGIIHVTYLGAIGNDEYGQYILDQLNREGICTRFSVKDEKTAICFVLLHNNKRTLCTDIAASGMFTLEDCYSYEPHDWAQTFVYFSVCDSFFLRISTDCVDYFLQKSNNLIFNLGAEFVLEQFPDYVIKIVQKARIIIGNLQEALILCKIMNKTLTGNETEDEILEISFAQWLKPSNQLLIVTNGEHPAMLLANGKTSLKKYPVPMTIVKDTNCAGDAFAGGFIAKYLQRHYDLHNKQKVHNVIHSSDDQQHEGEMIFGTNDTISKEKTNEELIKEGEELDVGFEDDKEVDLDECMKCALWTASEIVQNTGCNFNRNKSFT